MHNHDAKQQQGENIRSTLFILSDRTFSKTPNGSATEVGIPIQDGTFSFKNEMLRDLAPT